MKRQTFGFMVYIQHLADAFQQNKELVAFTSMLSVVIQFMLESIQIDILLIFGLIVMVGINTYTGIRLARKSGTFSLKSLKESIIDKSIGYIVLLIAVSVLMIILFMASLKDATRLVEDYYFNLPVVLLIVFLSTVEFKSALDNLEDLGVKIPGFVKRLPTQIQDKINEKTKL